MWYYILILAYALLANIVIAEVTVLPGKQSNFLPTFHALTLSMIMEVSSHPLLLFYKLISFVLCVLTIN